MTARFRPRTNPEHIAYILHRKAEGATMRAIADEMTARGWTSADGGPWTRNKVDCAIYADRCARGVVRRHTAARLEPSWLVEAMAARGMTIMQFAAALGVSRGTVVIYRRHGVPVASADAVSAALDGIPVIGQARMTAAEVRELMARHRVTCRALARGAGVSRGVVTRWRARGVPPITAARVRIAIEALQAPDLADAGGIPLARALDVLGIPHDGITARLADVLAVARMMRTTPEPP